MKKVMICSVAALVILLTGSMGLTKEEGKKRDRQEKKAVKNSEVSKQEKQWREKLKEMTSEQRRVAMAERAFNEQMAPWLKVRQIALGEKANKTVAAIDEIVAAKKQQFNKRMEAMKKGPRTSEKSKGEGKRRVAGEKKEKNKATEDEE